MTCLSAAVLNEPLQITASIVWLIRGYRSQELTAEIVLFQPVRIGYLPVSPWVATPIPASVLLPVKSRHRAGAIPALRCREVALVAAEQ